MRPVPDRRADFEEHPGDHHHRQSHAGKCRDLLSYEILADACIGCTLCARHCPVGAISGERRALHVVDQALCIKCGQCSAHCPVGAIYESDETRLVWDGLRDHARHCVVQIAPAVRVALGESFGLEPGTLVTGKIYAALRRLGFDAVFDTNFGADLTIMEEGTEFVKRFVDGEGKLPLITTCCPAWVDYMEKYWADMIPHFSSAKSPHKMVGVLAKTYYAKKMEIDPANVFTVSIMPCTAKKYEVTRSDDMYSSGYQDIDVSLTRPGSWRA